MKLYTDNQGNWTGTQADAKKVWGKDMALVEVPVSKEALMKWLNKCKVVSQAHAQIAAQTTREEPQEQPQEQQRSNSRWTAKDLNGFDIRDIAQEASLKDLTFAMSVYLNRLDEELS